MLLGSDFYFVFWKKVCENMWQCKAKKMKCNGDRQCNLKTFSKSFLYYAINIGLIGLLFAAIINTFVTYNKWPIYTEVIVVPQNQAKYPAITMCPISNGYKENVLQVNIFSFYQIFTKCFEESKLLFS